MLGTHVAVLYPASGYTDTGAISAITDAYDRAYEAYARFTGYTPTPYRTYEGRLSIAYVPSTLGNYGSGYLGSTGIEELSEGLDLSIRRFRESGTYDQVIFYELGRNFWSYFGQLQNLPQFTTGFAIANRFASMDYANIPGAPFGQIDFGTFREYITQTMFDDYLTSSLTYQDVLANGRTTPNPYNFGAADTAGGILYSIYDRFGADVYGNFYRTLGASPTQYSASAAMDQLVAAASSATGVDMSFLKKEGWQFIKLDDAANDLNVAAPQGTRAYAMAGSGDDVLHVHRSTTVHVDGGAGTDRVAFDWARGDYSILRNTGSVTVVDTVGGTRSLLTDVEYLSFQDGVVDLDLTGHSAEVYRLYQAAFDRVPDRHGLSVHVREANHGVSLHELADIFISSPEFQATYGSVTSDQQFVTALYDNVLHRAPDSVGNAAWLDRLATHQYDRAAVLAAFSESPENHSLVDPTLAPGIFLEVSTFA